jgi:transcriptional regulator with XRE-family HTH domain
VTAASDPTPLTAAFGRRVRELRQERGWSLRYTGDLVALNWGTVSKIETGAGTTLSAADRIAGAFGVPLAVMLAPDACANCHGAPHRGFICGTCWEPGPGVVT